MKTINPNDFLKGKKRKPTVCFPSGIPSANCELLGYFHEESNYYNIIAIDTCEIDFGGASPSVIGKFYAERPSESITDNFYGYYKNEEIVFYAGGEKCELEPVQLKMDIFSRNTGILESDIMLKKGAIIIGCGSVGSLVALELARAGVGRFFLVDMDILSYHNICRHQCGIQDVGKYKPDR